MRLFQIPFSHNCIKVRHVLELKGIPHETVDINPLWRPNLYRESGQMFVPALVGEQGEIAGSTAILLHLEELYPTPALLPADPRERAECMVLMDWADTAFMALTRRLAYHRVLSGPPGALGMLFFPGASERVRNVGGAAGAVALRLRFGISDKRNRADVAQAKRVAATAVERLGGADHLVGDDLTLADITLATMSAPLQYAEPVVTDDPAVARLLSWGHEILGRDFTAVPAAATAG